MIEKLNKDLILKRKCCHMIDKELAYLKEQRRKHNELDSDLMNNNHEFDKSITRTIMTLQTIRDELIPKEKPQKIKNEFSSVTNSILF